MLKKVADYCVTNGLICENDNIVAGISGGADSMCLLFLLHQMRSQFRLNLSVVHVNHKIRTEACEDAAYVERMCRAWEIPYYLYEVNVPDYAALHHLSEEEAGRKLRYQAFEEVLQKHFGGVGKIAVAHNQNDRAETVLFHLFRGTGIKGLSGINNMRDNIIRPIMCLNRNEIEEFLKNNDIVFCIDKTNTEDTYTRNRIRNHILTYASENITPRAVEHVNEAAELLEETQQLLERLSDRLYVRYVSVQDDRAVRIDCECLIEEPLLIRYMIMKCVGVVANTGKDITSRHISDIYKLMKNRTGRKIKLPYGISARKEYGFLLLSKEKDDRKENLPQLEIVIDKSDLQETVKYLPDGTEVIFKVFDREKSFAIDQKTYTKCFDYDKITKSLVIRYRNQGDYLIVDRRGSKKSLKQYLINEKIPAHERDTMPVLTEEDHVLWVMGMRISEYYKITDDTKKILQVQIRGGAKDGRNS